MGSMATKWSYHPETKIPSGVGSASTPSARLLDLSLIIAAQVTQVGVNFGGHV